MTLLCGNGMPAKGQNCPPRFMPFIEAAIATPDGRLGNRDRHKELQLAPYDTNAVSANFELRHAINMDWQAHTRPTIKTTRQVGIDARPVPLVHSVNDLSKINSPVPPVPAKGSRAAISREPAHSPRADL